MTDHGTKASPSPRTGTNATPDTGGALPAETRVFSGMQPSGEAHLGNYLGALRQWVPLQDAHECFFCIVDQHAIVGEYEPDDLPARVFDLATSFLAVGLDPERSTIFVQSDVPEHAELAWLFNSVTPVGDLERMTQYKDKSARYESIPAGLLNYPILQAADILLYRADRVPVGEDQLQHLELSREIARKWNARFGGYFPEPKPILSQAGRILGLDGNAKMSKSLENTVRILAEPEEIWGRVRTAVTDPQRVRRDDPGRPEVCNVYTLHGHFTDPERLPDIAAQCRAGTRGCVDCKRILAESIGDHFAEVRERAREYREDPGLVRDILEAGARRARVEAQETMEAVRDRMGIRWRSRGEGG
ncbi:MAG: tryptophan--tRNA ligase [Gemmatimonadales bacterium]|nr:MAG: tryptophan--tRNA ligase [Gemmatimonadales bacterium]